MARRNPYGSNAGIHIEWFTVKRSTIYTLVVLVVMLIGAGAWAYFQVTSPRTSANVVQPSPGTDKSARFIDLDGAVKVRKAGTYEWINAHMGITLNRDDTIRTVGDSNARVRLFDGTEYLVRPDSILVIEEASEDPETKATRVAVSLTAGRVNLKTPRGGVSGSRRDLQTPTTEATFEENTSADVSFDTSTRTSGFAVYTGQTALRAGEEELTLSSSQAVDVTGDLKFSKVIQLPGVPSLVTPANLSMIPVTPTTEFRWRGVEGARRYHVVLDRSPYFRDPILESTVPNVSVIHSGLAAGTYYWQVTAIDEDNRWGAPSEFAKFTISSRAATENAEPPELRVPKPSVSLDGLVTVRGRTEVGAVVTVDVGMGDDRVQVKSDGTFTYYFEVRETGRHPVVVRARRREGGGVAEKTVYAEIGTD